FYYGIVRGIDNRKVEPNRETKSIGAEDTFAEDLTSLVQMNAELEKIAVLVEERLKRRGLKGRTVTVKIKYHDFKIITRSRSFPHPIDDLGTITAKTLLAEAPLKEAKVRLLGITLSNFGESPEGRSDVITGQLQLFS
ncbi:MAG: DNA polymerase IV, partial [Chitinophagaceae bacterium]